MAQETEKEIQSKKDIELKKKETELQKANPSFRDSRNAIKQQELKKNELSDEEIKQIEIKKENAENLRRQTKQSEQDKEGHALPVIHYKVFINSQGQAAYKVMSGDKEIINQVVIAASGSLKDSKIQAEKEAVYASNALRKNINYPLQTLKSEIRALVAIASSNSSRGQINQNVLADYTFNGGGGTINSSGPATPYPSTINVSGVPAGATVKTVTLNGLNHTWADDVDIVLQSPTGVNVILMSDAGGSADLINHNYTFDDAAALSLQDGAVSASGTYKPTNFGTGDNWVAPGPGTAPSSTTLSTFGSANHNGTWSLFVLDDLGGDAGSWGSWSITFTDPASICFPITITTQPDDTAGCTVGVATFTLAAAPAGVSYNWQVDDGSGFVYLANGGVYSGVNSATLAITNPSLAMNGYVYRCVVTCSDGGLPEISDPVTLTVVASPPAPVVSPTSAAICPGGSQLIFVGGGPQTSFGGGPGVAIPGAGTSGPGAPYPSTITVAGLPSVTLVKSVTINGFAHTFPDDVDILLRSPSGVSVILMSDAGGATDATGQNFVFDDAAASLLADGAFNASGTYRPTNYGTSDSWIAPGPGTVNQTSPTLGSLGATNHNGVWELFIVDDVGGDIGSISGWSITFTEPGQAIFSPATGLYTDAGLTTAYTAGTQTGSVYASPAMTTVYSAVADDGTCVSAPTNITITVNAPPSITVQPGTNGNACAGGTKTFSVSATGTSVTYQWQVDNGGGFVNITGGSPTNPSAFLYSGYTTNTLTINDVLPTMNGYKYRCVVSGACPPALNSDEVTLVVNSLPTLAVTSSSQCAPTTLTASGADTYTWSPAAGLSATTGATVTANPTANTTYTVTGTVTATGCQGTTSVDVMYTPGMPVVIPSSATICVGDIQPFGTGAAGNASASSGAISVPIPDNDPFVGASHTLNIAGVPGGANITSISVTFNISHTWDADLDINLVAPNGNILNLVGARGGSGDNFINTTITSLPAPSLSTGSAPFTGTFAPDGNIGWGPASYLSNVSSFSSLFSVPNGTWRLVMADFASFDVGTLNSWSINIAYSVGNPAVWSPTTGLFTDPAGTVPYTGAAVTDIYASPASTTTYSVTVTNTANPTVTFSSGETATIPGVAPVSTAAGAGDPYPLVISVSGLPDTAIVKSVRIKGIKHSFPDDIDILLRSPTGEDVMLMSDAGGGSDLTGQSFTFDDAATVSLANSSLNGSGTYKPTNYGSPDNFPAPVGSVAQPTPNPTLSTFVNDPNGVWELYVNDGVSLDIGSLSGWEITFMMPNAVSCTSPPTSVTVTVHDPVVFTQHPQNRTACQGDDVSFTVAATGTIQTYQWQVSTNGGGTWNNIAGATTATLNLAGVTTSMNSYQYRCVLSSVGCGSFFSNAATLTVNPLPTVTLTETPTGQLQLRPGMLTSLSVSSTPAAASYAWSVNGTLQSGITTSTYVVDAYHLGTYTVEVTDVNGCKNTSNAKTFTPLPTNNLFIYPNPTSGAYYITYYTPQVGGQYTISVFDAKGRRIVEKPVVSSAPYTRFDFDASKLAAGVYFVELRDYSGNRLGDGRLVVIR